MDGFLTRTTNKLSIYLAHAGDYEKTTAECFTDNQEYLIQNYVFRRLLSPEGLSAEAVSNLFGCDLPETMQAELDLHYSSKHDPGKPTTLEFDLNRTQGDKTLSVTGMIKTAESWPFLPFSTDSAEILDITQTEAIENMIAQWAAGAITGIRHLPGETAEEE